MSEKQRVILCVDDESVGLRIRKLLLERAGYQVLTAQDGASGLAIFTTEKVDAVVLDYLLPGMHGGEIAAKMRTVKPHVPILLLSAYLGLPTDVTSVVDIYMTKGEGAPVLLQNVNQLFNLSKSADHRQPQGPENPS